MSYVEYDNLPYQYEVENTLEFLCVDGTLVQLVDESIILVGGEIQYNVLASEAYDEYYYLLDNERDQYLRARP
jgi:hypothetical protein